LQRLVLPAMALKSVMLQDGFAPVALGFIAESEKKSYSFQSPF